MGTVKRRIRQEMIIFGSTFDGACPTCGATPEELDLVRRRRALDAIMAEYEQHLSGCGECRGWAGPWCEAGRDLRRRYLDAWLAWQSWRSCEA